MSLHGLRAFSKHLVWEILCIYAASVALSMALIAKVGKKKDHLDHRLDSLFCLFSVPLFR